MIKNNLESLEYKIEEIEKKNLEEKEQYYNLKEIVSEDEKNIGLYNERIKNFEEKINRNNYELSDISTKISQINENKIILEEELAKRLEEQKFRNQDIEKLRRTQYKKF